MRRWIAVALLLVAVLAITNPSEAEYVAWLEERFVEEEGESVIVRLLGAPLISAATEVRSYGVLTVFRTGERVTVGVLGRFVMVR